MSTPEAAGHPATTTRKRHKSDGSSTLAAQGEPMIWLTGGGLALAVIMIVGLLGLVLYQGAFTLWPLRLTEVTLHDGKVHLGEVTRVDNYQPAPAVLEKLPEAVRARAAGEVGDNDGWARRRLLRTGNYELTGEHFQWVSDYEIREDADPAWALVLERMTWGRFYGRPQAFRLTHRIEAGNRAAALRLAADLPPNPNRKLLFEVGGVLWKEAELPAEATPSALVEVWDGPEAAWAQYLAQDDQIQARREQRRRLERVDTGAISHRAEKARLALRKAELNLTRAESQRGPDSPATARARQRLETTRAMQTEIEAWSQAEFRRVRTEINALNTENARYQLVMLTSDGRETPISLAEIARAYPANQLNWHQRLGIYFARWAEFLADDPREANMEGGVFPAIFGTVVMTLLMSLAVVPFGVLAALYLREYAKAGPLISAVRIAINNLAGVPSIVFGVFGLGFFCYLVGGSIDSLFFEAKLPSPTYGTGGIMWASLTLALLTLPVVIVATEEALAAVPGSMREGSYACGAGKWQTIRRIVLPRAMPGILTGAILAMARGAGEVAPLMLVGAVKLAPELPIDGSFPFLHPERSFMHLGFHIFDLGFQSQNSEAAKPMVFTTTLLLIFIVAGLNIAAVLLRNRLRKRFVTGAF